MHICVRVHINICTTYIYMGWLRPVDSLKSQVSLAEYSLFYRALLQKRPMVLRSLLIEDTPYPTYMYISTLSCASSERCFTSARRDINGCAFFFIYMNIYIYIYIYSCIHLCLHAYAWVCMYIHTLSCASSERCFTSARCDIIGCAFFFIYMNIYKYIFM